MRRTGSWLLLTGSMLLIAGCGGDDAADNAANLSINGSGEMMLGNDASAMEIVANQGSAVTPLPANDAAPTNGSRSQSPPSPTPSATPTPTRTPTPTPAVPPASDRTTPPGGDRGGNSSDSNDSGI